MALDKATLNKQIKKLLSDMRSREEVSDVDFAERLSSMIDAYVKTETITVAAGIPVSTAGSPTAQTGATTAPAVATIM